MTVAVRVARRAHREFRYRLTTRQRSGMIASASFALTALGARAVTGAIRGGRVKVFRDVTVGEVHLHHYLPGIALLTAAGAFGVAGSRKLTVHCLIGATYGAGCALIADELPLLINLRDVYWTREGRWAVRLSLAVIGAAGAYFAAVPFWQGIRDEINRTGSG
jgi:hypothetical protein